MTTPGVSVDRGAHDLLTADRGRVIAQLFVPGQEGFENRSSRAEGVLDRILGLEDHEVATAIADVEVRFAGRHRDLHGIFERHAAMLDHRLDPGSPMVGDRRLLAGATFTSEYAIEGAALCNPSIVAHPDQRGVAPGSLRTVMSVRAIGEGHRSSIELRAGLVHGDGTVSIDAPASYATTGALGPSTLHRVVFHAELDRLDAGGENADFVLDALGAVFDRASLDAQLSRLEAEPATRRDGQRIASLVRQIADRSYATQFGAETELSERVLSPATAVESSGMEDARFVRFTKDDGSITYYATYTAYDGVDISMQLLETADFLSFTSSPMVGPAAANKGLALFPRRIGGRYAALSRWNRESNSIAFSDNPRRWTDAQHVQEPARGWELLQLGNCGPPIETDAGWLVLTHGVGPMRTYSIGALLLDLDDPTRVLGRLREPLLRPESHEQDGYVPNVVYSCGALVHAGTLVLPYGIGDAAIGIATTPVADVLAALEAT